MISVKNIQNINHRNKFWYYCDWNSSYRLMVSNNFDLLPWDQFFFTNIIPSHSIYKHHWNTRPINTGENLQSFSPCPRIFTYIALSHSIITWPRAQPPSHWKHLILYYPSPYATFSWTLPPPGSHQISPAVSHLRHSYRALENKKPFQQERSSSAFIKGLPWLAFSAFLRARGWCFDRNGPYGFRWQRDRAWVSVRIGMRECDCVFCVVRCVGGMVSVCKV